MLKKLALCLAIGFISCSAMAEKTYTAATDATFAPFESLNKNREIVGFDADIIHAIAKKKASKLNYTIPLGRVCSLASIMASATL